MPKTAEATVGFHVSRHSWPTLTSLKTRPARGELDAALRFGDFLGASSGRAREEDEAQPGGESRGNAIAMLHDAPWILRLGEGERPTGAAVAGRG